MEDWYKVSVYRAHQGTGRSQTTPAYVFASDPTEVLNRYKRMHGVKRNIGNGPFPKILKISSNEELEDIANLIKKRGISVKKAKRTWVYAKYI